MGVPIAMHYIRTLCDKYFQSCDDPIISLTSAVNLTVISLIVSENQ